MYVNEIILKEFRNYSNLVLSFSPKFNFITGPNGIGKTNILEAITVLSNLRSFRNIHDSEIVRWGSHYYYCSCTANECRNKKFEVAYSNEHNSFQKKYKIDSVEIKSALEYYGRLLNVVFSPSDIQLVHGAPEIKRKYIDSIISKIDSIYFKNISDFKKVLFNRNRLLKLCKENGTHNDTELDAWDQMFAEKASAIIGARKKFIELYNSYFVSSYASISLESNSPMIQYSASLESDDSAYITTKLKLCRKKDILFGMTSVGPQRDDFHYICANRHFIQFASQGQKRTAAISLKIAEMDIIEKNTEGQCLILIDDIFSELDKTRQANMLGFLNRGNQVIFTMVDSGTIRYFQNLDYKWFTFEKEGVLQEVSSTA